MLKALRESLNISEEIHNQFEAEIKRELVQSETSPQVVSIVPNEMNLLVQDQLEELRKPESSASSVLKKVKFKKCITLGREKYRKKDYEGALKFFNQAKELSPDDEEVIFFIKKVNLKIHAKRHDENDQDISSTAQADVTAVNPSDTTRSTPRAAIPVQDSSLNPEEIPYAPAAIPIPETGDEESKVKSKEDVDEGGLLDTDSQCISCEGTGNCYWCNGTGKCDRCGGSGVIKDKPCRTCKGTGNCNSCVGSGSCPWCKGSGSRNLRKRTLSNGS